MMNITQNGAHVRIFRQKMFSKVKSYIQSKIGVFIDDAFFADFNDYLQILINSVIGDKIEPSSVKISSSFDPVTFKIICAFTYIDKQINREFGYTFNVSTR